MENKTICFKILHFNDWFTFRKTAVFMIRTTLCYYVSLNQINFLQNNVFICGFLILLKNRDFVNGYCQLIELMIIVNDIVLMI